MRVFSSSGRRISPVWSKRERAELKALVAAIRKHPDLAERLDLIYSVDGIGLPTAVAILVRMPEIGQITREQAAALAGLAPYDDDSGNHVGVRHIEGGRKRLRRALYTAALPASFRWNPQLITLYKRLIAAGKGHKRALVACARKLLIFVNTVVARGTPWGHERPPTSQRARSRKLADPGRFFVRPAPFLRPDLPSQRRRAQRPSRMVVAPMMHRIPLLPDHALTAASTASFCQSSGPISPNLMVATDL